MLLDMKATVRRSQRGVAVDVSQSVRSAQQSRKNKANFGT